MFTNSSKQLSAEQIRLLTMLGSDKLPEHIPAAKTAALCKELQLEPETLAQKLLPLAAAHALVPRSNFYVGAIVIDTDGALYFGANLELEYGPLTNALHAEQAALFNALRHQCSSLKSLVVNAAPCGYCRQFINEFSDAPDLQVRVNHQQFSFEQLLPYSFGPKDLGQEQGIAVERFCELTSRQQQLSASYAPYSSSPSILVAKAKGQDLVWSAYLENAAFSPSVSPFLLLLSQLQLQGLGLEQVDTIEVHEKASADFSFSPDVQLFLDHYPNLNISVNLLVE